MSTLTQTVLPFKVEATEEMLTANAGLALTKMRHRYLMCGTGSVKSRQVGQVRVGDNSIDNWLAA